MTDGATTASKYRPIAKLGQGGMAQVFLAMASGPVGFNKLVVIKEILEELADDPEFVTMFLDEARLAARLNHPNVVQTTEVGVEGSRYYICMEYLEGQPLNRIFGKFPRGELSRGMMVRILIDTLAGLHHAHEVCDLDGTPLQVVHRDVSPHNVFLTYAGQVKVVDFGIAKAVSSSNKTQTGVMKGKVNYMSPEQAQGEKVDRRSDVFAVGMMLWDVLAGRRPFQGMTDIAIIHKVMTGDIPSPRTVVADVPQVLELICMKALARDRNDRFATAAEMASALEEALDELGERGSVRDAGQLVATRFAEDRERMKKLIESQVAQMQRASATGPVALPVVVQERSELTSREGRGATPVASSIPSLTADSAREDGQSKSIAGAFAGRSLAPTGQTPRRSNRALLFVGAAAVIAAGAVAGVLVMRSQAPASAVSGPTASSSTAPTTHTVTIDSTPQGATVGEGDQVLGTTPMTLKLEVPSTNDRRLVMSLPGYAPHTFVPTAEDVRIQFQLAPLAAAAPSGTSGAAVSTGSTGVTKPVKPAGNGRTQPKSDDIKMTR
jgi:serine/threonine-protein kinase